MSWATTRMGKPPAIVKKLESDLASPPSHLKDGVELEIYKAVLGTAITAVKDYKGKGAVKVEASGHLSDWEGHKSQTLSLSVTPLGDFEE